MDIAINKIHGRPQRTHNPVGEADRKINSVLKCDRSRRERLHA